MRYKNRLMLLISLIFLLILIPTVCAVDNETAEVTSVSIQNNGSDILKASNDYYFDASVENDGIGSQANPYKFLTADRIKANANIYLANGQYNLDTSKSIQQVNIYGSDVEKTIIKYDGIAFTVSNYLNVKNITFVGSSITNYKQFTAVNTVFVDGYGSKPDSYTNNFGGAIFTDDDIENAYVSVDNCTFKNNYAQYGGAIYMGSGVLEVTNSLFYDNFAYNYGGSIACDYASNVTVKKSKFYNSTAQNDAGGSIYIRQSSKFVGEDITVVNSSATFGGAIATLNTDVSLNKLNMENNSAKYDGGAIYQMYGEFSLFYGSFVNNSASNGGALFVDNSTNMVLRANTFTDNHAENAAGAIFSLFNKFTVNFERWNTFSVNTAKYQNNVYYVNELNLIIGNRNYTMYNVDINPITHLPSRYSLIDDGYTTLVKDQQASGNCWAFTAIAVLESCILKASGDNLDLSEENMKNVMELYSDYGWKMDTNEGGYDYMPWGYLTSWLGPISETDDSFDDHSTLSPVINSIMHVQNIKFLNRASYTDNGEIKRAILQYGAVGTGIYYDPYYFNSIHDSYYNWVNSPGNHAVTIVGWDDSFSKSNFKFGSSIDGDGAWIVRNSWGPNWGNDGYFYVSYYDASFARPSQENCAYTIILNDTIKFDKNYQYDIAGMTDYFLNSSSNVWYKNKFTATSDEYLAAVSTYFEKISDWMASVYVNGELKDVVSGKTGPGYYTFNLNKLISLKVNDVFEVVFNITVADEVIGFPISEVFSLNKLTYSPGISYVSWDGKTWSDLYKLPWTYATHSYTSQVACIKAFTLTDPINTQTALNIDFVEGQPLNITATVKDEYGNLLKYGNVTFNVNGKNQIVSVKNGIANLLYDFKEKMFTVSATFGAEGYNQSSNISYFSIPKIPIKLKLNILQNSNNVDINVMANRLLNESVIVNINGNETLLELINGTNTLSLKNLSNSLYQVAVLLMDGSDYTADAAYDEFTIELLKTFILSDDLTVNDEGNVMYNITLLDEHDNPVVDHEIIFEINNATYKNNTDENGKVLMDIPLKKGVYDVKITFNGDNDYFNADATNTIKVKSKVLINLDVNHYNNNAIISIYASNRINETFTVLINNNPRTVESKDGIVTLKLYGLSDGEYNVSVLLNEDEYEFNEAKSSFIIQYGKSANVTADVENINGDAIINISVENATGYVTVIVDGVRDIVELENSHASYEVKNITPGNHSLVIIYSGEEFKETMISKVFAIAKKQSKINLTIDSSKVKGVSTITAEVTPSATGFVSVNVNGSEYLINLSKTKNLSLVFENAGEYPVVATYLGDNIYNSSKSGKYYLRISDKLMVNATLQIPEVIRVSDEVEFNISGDVPDGLKVYVDGMIQSISNKKIHYNALKAGLHNVQIVFGETGDYYGFNNTVSFEVVKNDVNIFINLSKTLFVGENITINPVTESDGKINITVNGQPINSSYVIPFKGAFVIEVESAETEMYKKSVNTTTFISQKYPTNIALNVSASKSGEKSKVSVNITNNATGFVIVVIDDLRYSLNLSGGNELEVVLDAGNHRISAEYLGDEKYQSSKSEVKNIVVADKLAANVKVEIPDDIKVGDKIAINITADTSADLIVTINGEPVEIVSRNGLLAVSLENMKGSVIYTVSHAGIYNIAVIAQENGEYLGQTVTKIFEASKKDAVLDIAPITDAKVGDKVTIKVSNETDGALSIKVNEETVTDEYEIIKSGAYTVTVESAATDAYNKGFATYTFNVEEPSIPKPVEPDMSVVIDNSTVGVVLPENASGNVSVKVDGRTVYSGSENKNFTVDLTGLSAGDHIVEVAYFGDEKYAAKTVTGDITIPQEETPEPDNNVTVIVDGQSYPAEIVDGKVVIDTNKSQVVVPETVVVDGVEYLVEYVNGTAVVDINKTEPVKELSNAAITTPNNVKSGETINVTVNIPSASGNVSVIVDGKESVVQLVNGSAVVPLENITEGDHDVVVIYSGDETHAPTHSVSTFSVPTEIVVESRLASQFNVTEAQSIETYAVDFPAGERGTTFQFQLTDSNGNPIANASVQFAYKTVIFNRTTDENGIVFLGVSTQFADSYLCALSYLGDDKHNATFVAFNFKLDKKPLSIFAMAKTFKSSIKTKKYTITLKTDKCASKDGKIYLKSGKKVTLKINGKTYKAKINAKGQATFKITKLTKKGKFTAVVKFSGDNTYKPVSKKVKITIK